jgi:enoyl-CoA hydratase
MTGRYLLPTRFISFEVSERVARITLNRPEKRNALTGPMIDELHGALLEADARNDVNVVVLQGAGKDFCAGYDLAGAYAGRKDEESRSMQAGERTPEPEGPAHYRSASGTLDDDCWNLERTQEKMLMLTRLHKPVIARIHGNCLAGGTDLALMCDMVVAAQDARIGFPATRANGTPPNHMWVYHVGPQWAKRLLMTGDTLTGLDAARIGLVLDAVPATELDAEVNELARRVSLVDAELLSVHKRIVNLALEIGGAQTLQRLAAEMDARAHLSEGPRRAGFKADMNARGLKQALKNRDEPFGDGTIRLRWPRAGEG